MSAAQEEAWVRQFGTDPIAYSTLQPGLRYFQTSFGFVAYRRVGGMDITLGPPVCAVPDRRDMLRRFRAHSRRPIFCYVQRDVIQDLHDSDLHCAGMGVDRYVDHATLLADPPKEVQGACRKADAADFRIQPVEFAKLGPGMRARLQAITQRYFAHAQCSSEMSFLNRPMTLHDDGLRRGFLLVKHDREHAGAFGYAVLNPIFAHGRVSGYLLDILRFEPTRLWGIWLSTVAQLSALLAREGKALSLGFCPLYGIERAPARSSAWLDVQMRWAARFLASSQYVHRLHELKSLIPGRDEPRYFASFSRTLCVSLFVLLRASGVSVGSLFGRELARSIGAGLMARPAGVLR